MKKMTIGLAVLALALAALLYIEHGRLGKLQAEARAAKEKLADLEKENHALDVRLRMYVKMAGDLEKKLSELEKEKSLVVARLRESESRLRDIQHQVEAMTPDELVQTTRSILKNNGVDKIDSGARFSMAAFKKNTTILLQWQEYITEKIPLLEEKANIQEKEILNLQNQVFLWEETDRLWRQKNTIWAEEKATLNSLLIDYQKMINSEKRKKLYSSVVGGLVGLGLGILIGK